MGRRRGTSAFPVARIKKMMQADEEVGKIATVTPVLVAKALECMMDLVVTEASQVAIDRGSRTVTPLHLKACVMRNDSFDFLRHVFDNVKGELSDQPARSVQRPSASSSGSALSRALEGGADAGGDDAETASPPATGSARGRRRGARSQISGAKRPRPESTTLPTASSPSLLETIHMRPTRIARSNRNAGSGLPPLTVPKSTFELEQGQEQQGQQLQQREGEGDGDGDGEGGGEDDVMMRDAEMDSVTRYGAVSPAGREGPVQRLQLGNAAGSSREDDDVSPSNTEVTHALTPMSGSAGANCAPTFQPLMSKAADDDEEDYDDDDDDDDNNDADMAVDDDGGEGVGEGGEEKESGEGDGGDSGAKRGDGGSSGGQATGEMAGKPDAGRMSVSALLS